MRGGRGGGAAALISWSEFRHATSGGASIPLDVFVPILFSTVIGSVSFWGSNIAFAKLQDLIPTKPLALPGQQVINAVLLIGILVDIVFNAADNARRVLNAEAPLPMSGVSLQEKIAAEAVSEQRNEHGIPWLPQ